MPETQVSLPSKAATFSLDLWLHGAFAGVKCLALSYSKASPIPGFSQKKPMDWTNLKVPTRSLLLV